MQRAGKELYDQVRGAFVARGTSLNSWCKESGVTRQWAEKVLKGERNSIASKKLVERILKSSGLAQ